MTVIGIDPGPEQSAFVRWDGERVLSHGIVANPDLRDLLRGASTVDTAVIEQIESFGMAVGRDVFETVFQSGRFFEVARCAAARITRKEVKLHLCGSFRAKDPNIRQALIDRFGGGKAVAIGRKASPGPLYGIRSHEWSALAVAITWHDQHGGGPSATGPVAAL